jgi:hypothetical protein
MVICDLFLSISELRWVVFREGMRIDRPPLRAGFKHWSRLQENRLCTVYLQRRVQDPGMFSGVRDLINIAAGCSRLVDTQFPHAGAQCAAVEPKDLCSAVFATHLPTRLLKYPDNIVTLHFIQRFFGRR